jgi:hypothetical protein
MQMVREAIIIGGGKSISEGLNLGLKEKIKDKFTIGCNYAFQTFHCTFTAFQDRDWYHGRPNDKGIYENPDIYSDLKELPLIIGINQNGVEEFKLDNTILLDRKEREDLTGVFALKLVLRLMQTGTVYLLGFDWTRRKGLPERDPNYNPKSNEPTHYYNNINHRGIGYVGYYENHNPNKRFDEFIRPDIKIYNVNPDSNIGSFEKIDYEQMFDLLETKDYNQEDLRQEVITVLS